MSACVSACVCAVGTVRILAHFFAGPPKYQTGLPSPPREKSATAEVFICVRVSVVTSEHQTNAILNCVRRTIGTMLEYHWYGQVRKNVSHLILNMGIMGYE